MTAMRTILLLIAGSAVALRGQDVPAGTKGTAEAVSADAEKASVPANAEAGEVESAELPAEGGNGDGFAARRASRRVAGMRSRLSILEALAPPGSEHREVRAPFYREFVPRDLTGVLELDTVGIPAEVESIFESRRVQRPDDGHLVFENAVFTEYADGEGSEEISRRLQLERGVYDLSMDLIVSDRPVVIEERDRRIESGGMLHDHATGLTHFTGGVRMVVYEEVPEGEATASAEAAPDAQPSPPATPPAVATPAAKPAAKPSARAAAKPAARAAAKPVAKPATRKPGTAAGRTRTSAKPR
jgi:hypothetical protein